MYNLKQILEIFRSSKGKNDVNLIKLLELKSIPNCHAAKIIYFSPIIFGRIILNQKYKDLEFSLTYHEPSKFSNELPSDDKLYIAIRSFAKRNRDENIIDEELLKEIIVRSPEIQSTLKSFKEYKNMDGTKFRTVLIM